MIATPERRPGPGGPPLSVGATLAGREVLLTGATGFETECPLQVSGV